MEWKRTTLGFTRALWLELVMAALAIVAIWLAVQPDSNLTQGLSLGIWAVFLLEYGWRFHRAPAKLVFVRDNLPDLIAILPSDFLRGARVLRLVRVLRVFRGFAVLWRVSRTLSAILRTNGLGYALTGTTILILASGMLMARIEPGITTIPDGVW